MTKPPEVFKVRAKSAFEAQILISILKNAGVTVFDRQDLRSDEFAMAQRLMHQTGVEILVPEDQAEDARRAIDAARAKGELLAGDIETVDDEAPLEVEGDGHAAPLAEGTKRRMAPVLAWVFFGTSVVFAYEWLESRRLLAGADQASGWIVEHPDATTTRYLLRRDRTRVIDMIDRNGNGIAERAITYNLDGSEEQTWDDDEDGRPDRLETRAKDGTLIQSLRREAGAGWVPAK